MRFQKEAIMLGAALVVVHVAIALLPCMSLLTGGPLSDVVVTHLNITDPEYGPLLLLREAALYASLARADGEALVGPYFQAYSVHKMIAFAIFIAQVVTLGFVVFTLDMNVRVSEREKELRKIIDVYGEQKLRCTCGNFKYEGDTEPPAEGGDRKGGSGSESPSEKPSPASGKRSSARKRPARKANS